jgi:RNA polymerase sigma factor (sigma-70 family)
MPFLRTNRALLDRFRAGDPEALEQVYWEYVRKVERLLSEGFQIRSRGTRVAGLCHQPDDLADLVQEVFLRVFSEKGRRAYDGIRDFGPYLYTVARNMLVDWARLRGREVPAPWAEIEEALDVEPILDNPAPWAEPATIRVVEEYLAGLSADLRQVHCLRHEECLSQEEVGKRLGLGRQAIRTLERRLQDGLAAALDSAGIGPNEQPELTRPRNEDRQAG